MDFEMKKLRLAPLILLLLLGTACDILPGDFFPKPPTLIPITSTPASSPTSTETNLSTIPGFPTLSASETQSLPTDAEAATTTPVPTETRRPPEPSIPFTPTITPRPEPYFGLQTGSPQPLVNFLEPEAGCNWMGIGGQLFDLQGAPLVNYLVRVEGQLAGQQISVLALSGGEPRLGQGGYVLEIASQPIESSGDLYLQVLDLSGQVLSDKIFITTYADCEKNLILLNFSQLPPNLNDKIFLPVVSND